MKDIEIVAASREHINDIVVVENLSFKIPWSRQSIVEELLENKIAIYFCALTGSQISDSHAAECGVAYDCNAGCETVGRIGGKAVGYAGMWQILDEGHITNIAVHPEFRNYGVGSALLEALLSSAEKLGIIALTLEVRRSNYSAQALYKKFGFADGGMRKAYYADNNEDAIIMWKRLD
jgi:[ribosomal protein S18]-alanine N-acetyltransferase